MDTCMGFALYRIQQQTCNLEGNWRVSFPLYQARNKYIINVKRTWSISTDIRDQIKPAWFKKGTFEQVVCTFELSWPKSSLPS